MSDMSKFWKKLGGKDIVNRLANRLLTRLTARLRKAASEEGIPSEYSEKIIGWVEKFGKEEIDHIW